MTSITHIVEKLESLFDFPLPSQRSNQVVKHNHLRVYPISLHLLKELQGFFFISSFALLLNAIPIPYLLPLNSSTTKRERERMEDEKVLTAAITAMTSK